MRSKYGVVDRWIESEEAVPLQVGRSPHSHKCEKKGRKTVFFRALKRAQPCYQPVVEG